jgi:hypothetical protein
MRRKGGFLSSKALRLLGSVSANAAAARSPELLGAAEELSALRAADLIEQRNSRWTITEAGRAHLARAGAHKARDELDPFLSQHVGTTRQTVERPEGRVHVRVDEAESPLAWLARRKGRDSRPLIEPEHLLAGERLRADFTRAQLMPRITSSWDSRASERNRGVGFGSSGITDTALAAKQRVRHALETVGPEFSGLLLDVCCFLKGLEDVERERQWPPRSGKVVLQLGLDRLARHYGYESEARGRVHAALRTWMAESDAAQE